LNNQLLSVRVDPAASVLVRAPQAEAVAEAVAAAATAVVPLVMVPQAERL
jgi:hypothetical protein